MQLNNNNHNNKQPDLKWAEDLNRYFSKEDTEGQEAHEKMFDVTDY